MKSHPRLHRWLHRLRIAARWVVAVSAFIIVGGTTWLWIDAQSQRTERIWFWCRYLRTEIATADAPGNSQRAAELSLYQNWEAHARSSRLLIAWNHRWIEPKTQSPPPRLFGRGEIPMEMLTTANAPVRWQANTALHGTGLNYWRYKLRDGTEIDQIDFMVFGVLLFYFDRDYPEHGYSDVVNLRGLRFSAPNKPERGMPYVIELPYWMLLLASGLPLLWLSRHPIRAIIKLRRGKSACERCGYSLCGLPTGTVCPECGHAKQNATP